MESDPELSSAVNVHEAIGEAIEAYSRVELCLAILLGTLLKINQTQAYVLLFAIQNVRSRNEVFQKLLKMQFGLHVKNYWKSCSAFLEKLQQFRNAIAHWHPTTIIRVRNPGFKPVGFDHGIRNPVPHSENKTLILSDFNPFLVDCMYINQELSALRSIVESAPEALPEKFLRPISRRNQAVLQRLPTAKAPQPQRKPSAPKLSRAQKRKNALKTAKSAKKK
jgi:hypothetical protein